MQDYQENKWPYVHTQYGVFDPHQGKVSPTKSREKAISLAEGDTHYGPAMQRSVSDWTPIE